MLSDLGSPSNGSRILPLEENDVYKSIYDHSKRERPEYGYAGNRCFTPEARFTGIMDFLTQSPEHMHASYNKKKLGTFYKEDMAANRKHYMDPLDNNQRLQVNSAIIAYISFHIPTPTPTPTPTKLMDYFICT